MTILLMWEQWLACSHFGWQPGIYTRWLRWKFCKSLQLERYLQLWNL